MGWDGYMQIVLGHMSNKSHLCSILLLLIFISGCGEKKVHSGKTLLLDETEFVTDFPNKLAPAPSFESKFDMTGALDLLVTDSCLYVSGQYPNGYIRALDKKNGSERARFLMKGNAPNEVHDIVYFSTSTIVRDKGGVSMWINDEMGHLKKIDLTRSTQEQRTIVSDTVSIPAMAMATAKVGEKGVFYTTINANRTSLERHILDGKVELDIPALRKLNAGSVNTAHDGFLFNLLSTHVSYSWYAQRIIEASVFMNTIHLYSLDGTFGKTVCLGAYPSDIEQMEAQGVAGMAKKTFMLKSYPVFFAVLMTENPGEEAHENMVLLIFNYDGDPLLKVALEKPADAFDIDLETFDLYTLSWEDERLYSYDISGN